MRCPVCGKDQWIRKIKKDRPIPIATYTVKVEYRVCANCGHEEKVE
jgi:C4-type Zn-finger protein